MIKNHNKFLILTLFVFIIVSLISLVRNPLLNDDAASYALSVKNAVLYNQWLAQFVTPGDISSFLDKPPLGIWMLAWIPKIVGINELTIHLPNVFYYTAVLLLLYFSLSKLASKRIALYSTIIASTSLALVVYSRTPKLDIPLTLLVLAAHLLFYAFLKKGKPVYLYLFSICVALGFLIKSGFGILIPGLTLLGLFVFNNKARNKLLKLLFSSHFFVCLLIFITITAGVLGLQSIALKDYWLPYLKSITVQSKYNVGYLGFGFNYSIIGFLIITIFPWASLFLSSLKLKFKSTRINLNTFCFFWFWPNFIFLLFFYRQTDFRTFTALVPPMAIIAAIKMISIFIHKKSRLPVISWNTFFLIIFALSFAILIINPQNAEGINLGAALIPLFFFVFSLILVTTLFGKPSNSKLSISLVLICFSYGVLFYNTLPLANSFNLNVKWPGIIKSYQQKGYNFYIYRPPDRNLFMSSDLLYVDFMSGPADKYFWKKEKLKEALSTNRKVIILSDTKSWNKLTIKDAKIIEQDSYSSLILR